LGITECDDTPRRRFRRLAIGLSQEGGGCERCLECVSGVKDGIG
jgi:hypothetical protein